MRLPRAVAARKSGLRFSRKALMPSTPSALAACAAMVSLSSTMCDSKRAERVRHQALGLAECAASARPPDCPASSERLVQQLAHPRPPELTSPQFERLAARQRAIEQQQLHRPLRADGARQQEGRAAIRRQADTGVGEVELGAAAADGQIRHGDQTQRRRPRQCRSRPR